MAMMVSNHACNDFLYLTKYDRLSHDGHHSYGALPKHFPHRLYWYPDCCHVLSVHRVSYAQIGHKSAFPNSDFVSSGSMVAAPFAAILSDRFGRRKAMFLGAIVIIVGAIIVSTSSHVAQFVVGRFILGMGIQVMTVAAPAYAVEISPPHWRGRCTGKGSQLLCHAFAYSLDIHS